jgi:hypothetical protein
MSVKIGYEPLENWLSEYTNPTTRYQNRKFFDVYLQWTGKTPKELIDSFDQIKTKSQILQFQNYLLNDYVTPRTKKMMPNSARSHLTSVRAFYASQKEPIRGLKNKIIDVEAAKGEHTFSIEDLRSMFAVANLRDKALIATSTSLGWEISAIQALEKDFIENACYIRSGKP